VNPFPWHRGVLSRLLADRGRLPHALLVHGPAGIGKIEFARSLAASVLCETPRKGLACGTCPSCHWFSQGNHPDFREIVPESALEDEEGDDAGVGAKVEKAKSLVIKIEQVRAVADFMALTTHRAGYRVLLIHPAEAMHPAAANALLKTLEEPPAHTLIVLVSDQPARLLATIRSRCRLLPLAAPPREEALEWLRAQDVAAPESALAGAGGAPLLARDLAEPPEAELRKRVLAELSRPSGADPVQFAAGMEKANVERFIYWMQTWVHDLLRMRLAGEARHHGDLAPALKARAQAADVEGLFALERELAMARSLASHPLNARLVAEHLLMAYNQATRPRGDA
jgi:DNA polymerase-3 subunit delta'